MFFVSQGQVIEVACPASHSWDKTSNLSTSTSAAGYTRASYFGGPRVLRTMKLSVGVMTPEEQAKIDALTHLGFGSQLGFIPCGAERSNLMPPGASLLATVAGVVPRATTVASDGTVYPGGVNTPTTALVASAVPFAYPGQVVSLSIVGRAGAAMSIQWLDATGASLGFVGAVADSAGYTRVRRGTTAPATAVAFNVHVKGDLAAPALTLGSTLYPWQVGQVAKSVVIESAGVEVIAAWDTSRAPLQTHTYTIKEVGDYV
ncbi:hypothetical protein [Rothia nasimurium]|uniref:hypothetical protein n=1 Tax=Rothia nasimurium TaxID=85336 RepID=UPI003BA388C2